MNTSNTKEQILLLLEANKGSFISGQEIADRLFLTRAAVWKGINALKNRGIEIEAVTNRGYRLKSAVDKLSEEKITSLLNSNFGIDFPLKLCIRDEVSSTNELARDMAGSDSDLCVIADSQTAGRGRRGRTFFSPSGTGLYLSFLIHPQTSLSEATGITAMTAVAVREAIAKVTGLDPKIKWVNDIFLGDKKVAGILTEAVTSIEDASLSYVIVGIGINVFEPEGGFPKDIAKTAGALYPTAAAAPSDFRNILAVAIVESFFNYYKRPNDYPYTEKYRTASCLIGSYIKINSYSADIRERYALVTGIDDSCRLLIRYDNGTEDILSGGEVSVVRY